MKRKKLKIGDFVVGWEVSFRGIVIEKGHGSRDGLLRCFWFDEPDGAARQYSWEPESGLISCLEKAKLI